MNRKQEIVRKLNKIEYQTAALRTDDMVLAEINTMYLSPRGLGRAAAVRWYGETAVHEAELEGKYQKDAYALFRELRQYTSHLRYGEIKKHSVTGKFYNTILEG